MALVIKELIIWESKCHQNSPGVIRWLCEVQWYEEAEVHRSAIMQDFRDNEKKKMADWRPCRLLLVRNCHGLSLCETLHFVLYSWSSYFAFF